MSCVETVVGMHENEFIHLFISLYIILAPTRRDLTFATDVYKISIEQSVSYSPILHLSMMKTQQSKGPNSLNKCF